jgi:hypothetical protein
VRGEGHQGYDIPGLGPFVVGSDKKKDETDVGVNSQRQQKKGRTRGKRNKWGPVQVERRSTRFKNDGRTSLEKAQENKKKMDLEELYNKGKNKKPSKNLNSKHLINVASVIGVDLGDGKGTIEENLDVCVQFDEDKLKHSLNPTNGGVGCKVKEDGNISVKECVSTLEGKQIEESVSDQQGKHPDKHGLP